VADAVAISVAYHILFLAWLYLYRCFSMLFIQHLSGLVAHKAPACLLIMMLLLQAQLFQLFPHATVWTAYGMTEGASSLTFQQLLPPRAAAAPGGSNNASIGPVTAGINSSRSSSSRGGAGSFGAAGVCVGAPAPGVTIRIQQQPTESSSGTSSTTTSTSTSSSSSSGGISEAPAEPFVGEVVTRGPHVMLGYWGDASATAQVLSPGGWFHTGDLGWLDAQGRLWLAGRSKDMVKTGGENVLAAEVERVLLTHPGVAAAAVVGVPHARLGEQVGDWLKLHCIAGGS
jgi:acyl-activating enzyme 14